MTSSPFLLTPLPPLSHCSGYRSYPTSTLVSSKQLTSYSDFRMPLSHTDHLTLDEYCEYLEAYVHHFKLPTRSRKWRMNTKVMQIRRAKEGEEGNHILTWEDLKTGEKGSEWYDALALCTGLHVEASVPEIPGFPPLLQGDVYSDRLAAKKIDTAKKDVGEVKDDSAPSQDNLSGAQARILSLHSSQFKDPQIFKDQRVLIMGTGETGMDMGYLAVKNGAKEIVMCTRGGFLSFPAVLSDFVVMGVKFEGKLPIDGLISNLFEVSRNRLRRKSGPSISRLRSVSFSLSLDRLGPSMGCLLPIALVRFRLWSQASPLGPHRYTGGLLSVGRRAASGALGTGLCVPQQVGQGDALPQSRLQEATLARRVLCALP